MRPRCTARWEPHGLTSTACYAAQPLQGSFSARSGQLRGLCSTWSRFWGSPCCARARARWDSPMGAFWLRNLALGARFGHLHALGHLAVAAYLSELFRTRPDPPSRTQLAVCAKNSASGARSPALFSAACWDSIARTRVRPRACGCATSGSLSGALAVDSARKTDVIYLEAHPHDRLWIAAEPARTMEGSEGRAEARRAPMRCSARRR